MTFQFNKNTQKLEPQTLEADAWRLNMDYMNFDERTMSPKEIEEFDSFFDNTRFEDLNESDKE